MKDNIFPSDARRVFSRGKKLSLNQSALPGQTISTCPTLKPCTIEGADLSHVKRNKIPEWIVQTMVTFSILQRHE